MKIRGLTVCVNDSERLAQTLPLWMPGLVQCQVVVDGCNEKDILAARACDSNVYVTNQFYTDGFEFNVGRALERARTCVWGDWVLIFDCGLKPPKDWLARLEALDLRPGNLYVTAGLHAFDLFHINDPALGDWAGAPEGWAEHSGPLIATDSDGELGYGKSFRDRWPSDRIAIIAMGHQYVGIKQSDPPTNKSVYDAHIAARTAKIAARASNVIPMRGGV